MPELTQSQAQLVSALAAARAAIDAALIALVGEAAASPVPTAPDAGPDVAAVGEVPTDQASCPHPEAMRHQIKSFGCVEHWRCDNCGYEYRR